MHRLALICLSFAICLTCALADDSIPIPWGNKFFVPNNPPAVIVHDFGAVPKGTILTKRFQVTNLYAVPMQVMDIRVSCGCVTPALKERVLQPRESSYIEIQMDSRKFEGHKAVSVWVDFGPNYRSSGTLMIRAFSRTDVTLNPGLFDFGVLPQGSTPTGVVEVAYTGTSPNWQITGVLGAEALQVKPEILDLGRQANGRVYQVKATLKPTAPAGALQETLQLQTNDPNNPTIPVNVAALLQAPFNVVPPFIRFDNVRLGDEVKPSRLIIQGARPFRILRTEGEGEGLVVNHQDMSQRLQVIEVRLEPKMAGKMNREIKLITDQNEVIVVPIQAQVDPMK